MVSQTFDPTTGAYTLRYAASSDPDTPAPVCHPVERSLHYPNGVGHSVSPEGVAVPRGRAGGTSSSCTQPAHWGAKVVVRVWRL